MDSNLLKKLCSSNKEIKSFYYGIYSCDLIPETFLFYPCFIIVNTHSSNERGEHWLVFFYISPSYVEIFDSLGFNIHSNLHFFNYIKKNLSGSDINFNTKQLQSSNSDLCGLHALYFLFYKCKTKKSLSVILKLYYTENKDFNDCLVFQKVKKHYNISNQINNLKGGDKC